MNKMLLSTAFLIIGWLLSFCPFSTALFCQNQLSNGNNKEQTFTRIHDDVLRQGIDIQVNGTSNINDFATADSICNLASFAKHGQIAPGTNGGTLNPLAFMNPTTINSSGRIAFYSQVNGSTRNQGIFAADSNGIYAIAIGAGAGGGSGDTSAHSGDPSPIGGTFGGFFAGTVFTPAINDEGDVLFLCDVIGGSSSRGLFLYQNATQQIVKIAAVGDPSPLGGIFSAVGPGSINNNGKVVFIASPEGSINSNIFMWDNGSLSKVAASGDPAPGGGTFSYLGTESYGFVDGTNIPVGPVPDINDLNQITFRAIVSGGSTERGIIVRTNGNYDWYIKASDPTPIGGTYLDFQAASINNSGQIAFFADYHPTVSTVSSGWFAGAPGNWRKVIVFYDPIDGGQCLGLAFSRNPMQTIDENGNVVFWTDLSSSGGSDRMVLGLANGDYLIAGRRGDPSPIGGTIGSMDAWPSLHYLWGSINAATPGATGGALSAHLVYQDCGAIVPAELVSFSASSDGTNITLNWSTATETNNRGFEIERKNSEAGGQRSEWDVVGFITGYGTTTEPKAYSFRDHNITSGTYSYRLKQIDYDGTFEYSNEVEINVTVTLQFALNQNYPNPFNPATQIEYSIPEDGFVRLNVYNALGQKVAELVNGFEKAGNHKKIFNAQTLASGVYYYRLETGSYADIKKLLLVK
jgi:hypothetical protein